MALATTRTIAILGSVVIALGVGAFLFAWSGIYNIAASEPHFAITYWLLDFGKRRAVETHSLLAPTPVLDDPNLVALGAGHFHGGCAPCHGAPGEPSNPIIQRMLPRPPDLARVAPTWTPKQLFWIAKHGLKFTGMPAWVAPEREDELWAIVAFLRALPKMDAAEYRRLAKGDVGRPSRGIRELATHGSVADALSRCHRCHETQAAPSPNRLIPKLAGQSQAYLEMSLRNYANGLRPSGIMQPMAAGLDERTLVELAKHYAEHPVIWAEAGIVQSAASNQIERGKRIASTGVPEKGVPPCLACHAGKSAATFPKLDGQHAPYIAGQLRLWRRGLRSRTVHGAIMAAIAPRLSEEQVEDVAAYFESVTSTAAAPEPPPAPPLPPRRRR